MFAKGLAVMSSRRLGRQKKCYTEDVFSTSLPRRMFAGCLLNLMKQKALTKQTGSFKIKFDKKCYIKIYLSFNLLCAPLEVIYVVFLTF